MKSSRTQTLAAVTLLFASLGVGCGDNAVPDKTAPGSGGSDGSGGSPSGNVGGAQGLSGSGGSVAGAGAPAAGGSSGSAGALGAGGFAGSAGAPGAGGSAGSAGALGSGGSAGSAGASGSGGSSGSVCNETSGLDASVVIHVAPSGTAAGDGSSFQSAKDLKSALASVGAGQLLLLEPGTYAIPYVSDQANTITLSKSGSSGAPIMIAAANCGRATIDFSFPEQAWVQDSYGFFLTGSYWLFKGIEVTRAGYQGVYVTGQHNTFDACSFHDNRNTGLEINEGGAYTTVINCDSYRNYDPKKLGSMADGFGPKQTQGPGNVFVGCRAWENSDDGFDAFDSPQVVVIEKSWAFRNGVDIWQYGGFTGNGNGFKLGGNSVVARNRITNSVAFGNVKKGFDQNNNAGGVTLLNNTGYANGTNFGFGNPVSAGETHLFRNNISLGAAATVSNADAQYNSWNSGFSVSAPDFQSVDLSQATVARHPDGSLPETLLFRLVAGSALVNAGTDVGLPFVGSAPDLGAFERPD